MQLFLTGRGEGWKLYPSPIWKGGGVVIITHLAWGGGGGDGARSPLPRVVEGVGVPRESWPRKLPGLCGGASDTRAARQEEEGLNVCGFDRRPTPP